ncbi:hypothetical protein BEH94_08895 [Candidatus Altiarchaeales archaeon WOR_SM1_SCG]|nr:hypothetical protein BEH94_08895 [Candidatus Altiarchaeales archaeon WOR_SM1_SCG]
MEAIIKGREIILPEEIKTRSLKADVIQSGGVILIMPNERESLRGVMKGKSKKSSVELVRELRDENESKRLEK